MTYPPLPEPIIIEGRRLYTAGQMREYAKQCANIQKYPEKDISENRSDQVDELMNIFGMKK